MSELSFEPLTPSSLRARSALLERFAALGIEITHLHGLTETFGPVVICDRRAEWDELPAPRRAQLKARQGVGNVIAQRARVVVFRDELPRTATGKAQKFQLREQLQGALTARAQTKR